MNSIDGHFPKIGFDLNYECSSEEEEENERSQDMSIQASLCADLKGFTEQGLVRYSVVPWKKRRIRISKLTHSSQKCDKNGEKHFTTT